MSNFNKMIEKYTSDLQDENHMYTFECHVTQKYTQQN